MVRREHHGGGAWGSRAARLTTAMKQGREQCSEERLEGWWSPLSPGLSQGPQWKPEPCRAMSFPHTRTCGEVELT